MNFIHTIPLISLRITSTNQQPFIVQRILISPFSVIDYRIGIICPASTRSKARQARHLKSKFRFMLFTIWTAQTPNQTWCALAVNQPNNYRDNIEFFGFRINRILAYWNETIPWILDPYRVYLIFFFKETNVLRALLLIMSRLTIDCWFTDPKCDLHFKLHVLSVHCNLSPFYGLDNRVCPLPRYCFSSTRDEPDLCTFRSFHILSKSPNQGSLLSRL